MYQKSFICHTFIIIIIMKILLLLLLPMDLISR